MGTSTNGIICFGVILPEETYNNIPWGEKYDFDNWYCKNVLPFVPTEEIYKENRIEKDGVTEGMRNKYYDELYEFKKKNPCPFELVNYCSSDVPNYILAIKSTVKTAWRGCPQAFDSSHFNADKDGELTEKLLDFCEKYKIEYECSPEWYICSYWG